MALPVQFEISAVRTDVGLPFVRKILTVAVSFMFLSRFRRLVFDSVQCFLHNLGNRVFGNAMCFAVIRPQPIN